MQKAEKKGAFKGKDIDACSVKKGGKEAEENRKKRERREWGERE